MLTLGAQVFALGEFGRTLWGARIEPGSAASKTSTLLTVLYHVSPVPLFFCTNQLLHPWMTFYQIFNIWYSLGNNIYLIRLYILSLVEVWITLLGQRDNKSLAVADICSPGLWDLVPWILTGVIPKHHWVWPQSKSLTYFSNLLLAYVLILYAWIYVWNSNHKPEWDNLWSTSSRVMSDLLHFLL